MLTKKNAINVLHEVKDILEKYEETREDDNVLYIEFCRRHHPAALQLSFSHVLTNFAIYGLPRFETVRRSRQRVQAKYPHLRASDDVRQFRSECTEAYKAISRSEV